MSELTWQEAVAIIQPYVVRVSTPTGSGTGFLFAYAINKGIAGVATAAHVINHAHAWEQPIRLQHHDSGKALVLRAGKRGVLIEEQYDTATIICEKGDLPLPDDLHELTPEGKVLRVGIEVGWVGFPAVAPESLCFFSGRISAWLEDQESYLVDGVVINGVSGAPAFHLDPDGKLILVGVVSAYVPNRATGVVLPGLSVVRHVGQMQRVVKDLRSLEEGLAKQTPPEEAAETPKETQEGG
jgi:hypothetical protein